MAALEAVVEPVVTGMGYELVELQAANGGRMLRLFIDKPGGIRVEDCAAVSRQLSRVLEVEGVDYERLEVSSPGLDRPLRRQEHFAAAQGHRVRLRTTGKKLRGEVLAANEQSVTVAASDGAETEIPYAEIVRANLIDEGA